MSHVYCPECGFQNPEASNYCSRCGALLATETGSETTMSFDVENDGEEVDLLAALGSRAGARRALGRRNGRAVVPAREGKR